MSFRFIRDIKMVPIFVLFAVLLLPVGGCATSEPATDSCTGQRLIITIASPSEITVPELQTVLGQASGKPVAYMRTLFERHYLFCVSDVSDEQDLAGVMSRMKGRPEIQGVEPDRMRRVY